MRTVVTVVLAMVATAGCAQDTQTGPVVTAPSKVYVADETGGTVSVINPATRERVGVVDLSETVAGVTTRFAPHNVQAAPDGRSVWVTAAPHATGHGSSHGSSHGMGQTGSAPEQVVVIDPNTDTIQARIAVGAGLHLAHIVLDAGSRYAYVSANEANAVLRIDTTTRTVVQRYELGDNRGPHGMRFCGDSLYVANMQGNSLSVIDPATGAVREITVGGMAVQVACVLNGRYVFASLYDTREVVRLEVGTATLTRIALPTDSQGPVQLYATPAGRVFVCDQGALLDRPVSNKLYEIDATTATVTATIEVGRGAHGVVLSHDAQTAFVTNTNDNSVSMVDLASRRSVATITVGEGPNGVSLWRAAGGMP